MGGFTAAKLKGLGLLPALGQTLACLGRACQDLLFPPNCLSCRSALPSSRPPLFCSSCREQLQWLQPPLCSCCGRPFTGSGADHFCGNCLSSPPHFRRARAALLYHGPVVQAIQACKYQGDLAGLSTFAALTGDSAGWRSLITLASPDSDETSPDGFPWDYVIPVPLHVKRLQSRGFNQALLLAQALFPGKRTAIRPDLLLRLRWTEPQTGMSGGQRRRNLRRAFAASKPEELAKRKVLLIDDVFTTGSTANECAKALKAAGAAGVDVFTLARVRE